MKQDLLWIPPAVERSPGVTVAPPVPFQGPEPLRVWTLYHERDPAKRPTLPVAPVHHHNAFLEDYVHDWNVRKGQFLYASRAMDGGVWLLLEYR